MSAFVNVRAAWRNAHTAAFGELRNGEFACANIVSIFYAGKICYPQMPIDVDDTCLWPGPAK